MLLALMTTTYLFMSSENGTVGLFPEEKLAMSIGFILEKVEKFHPVSSIYTLLNSCKDASKTRYMVMRTTTRNQELTNKKARNERFL